MKKTVYLRLTLVLFLTVMTLLSFSASAEDASFENEAPTLELLVSSEDDEGVEIILKLNSEHGLAAILAELNYDGEDFLFLGCGSDIMTVTYSDVGDGVRFLLDLSENSPSECVLATFYFKKIGSGGGDFSLNIGDDADCLYFEEGNSPVPAKPTLCGVCGVDGEAQSVADSSEPRLLSVSFENCGGKSENGGGKNVLFHFEVDVGKKRFAAGIKLFAVDLESGESREYYILGITGKDGVYLGNAEIELYEKAAVIVTAAGYEREGMVCGEKLTALIP